MGTYKLQIEVHWDNYKPTFTGTFKFIKKKAQPQPKLNGHKSTKTVKISVRKYGTLTNWHLYASETHAIISI